MVNAVDGGYAPKHAGRLSRSSRRVRQHARCAADTSIRATPRPGARSPAKRPPRDLAAWLEALPSHDADAFHTLFELNGAKCVALLNDTFQCSQMVRWLSSAGLAFLDGHVRQLPAAL